MKRDTFQRKGISPLIAAVLLIAFTMAVAAILTAFVTTFTQERTSQVSGQGEQLIDCSEAVVDIVSYDSSNDRVTVTNSGQVDLSSVEAVALSGASIVAGPTSGIALNSGETASITFNSASGETKVRVQSGTDCPSKSDTIEDDHPDWS